MIKIEDILKQLFYGEINISEKYAKVSDEEEVILDKKYELEEEFTKNLSEEQIKMFEEIFNLNADYHALRNENFFMEGVKLGYKLSKRLEEDT